MTRAQLRDLGVSRHALRRHLEADRWRLAAPHVVVLHTGPLSPRQQQWLAVLHAGPGALLAGRTAAQAHGLSGMESSAVHVLTRRGSTVRPLPGVRVHEVREALPTSVHLPPRQPLANALISAAGWSPTAAVAAGIVASGVQQRRVTPEQSQRALGQRQIRHAALLRQVLDDLSGGAQSFAEIDAGRLARRAGIGPPQRQAVRIVDGRRRYLDAAFDGWAMEIDGAVHLEPGRHAADLLRHNALVLGGDRLLRFSALTVRTSPATVIAQMRAADARWGRGNPRAA